MKSVSAVLLILFVSTTCFADENWPNWRGPNSNGVANGDHYPTSWGEQENVKWKADLPAFGSSTPAVWGEKIFVTTPNQGENFVYCYDFSGKKLWEAKIGKAETKKHNMASSSNPSPVTDGKHVWVYFKSGDFGCLDFGGKVVWTTNLQSKFGDDTLWWDLGTSPVLTKEYVVVACMQEGPSYVAAFKKNSGELAWKQDRTFDVPKENEQSYTTPIVNIRNDKEEIIVLGADAITAHDSASGKEIWRVGGLNPDNKQYWRSISSAVLDDGVLYAPYARGGTLTAVKVGGQGDTTKENTLWTKSKISIDVPTPTVKGDKVYICNDKGVIECIDKKSGNTIWKSEKLGRGKFYSSPIIGGENIYATSDDGTTYVVNLVSKKVVGKNRLGSKTAASPVLVHGKILIRASDALYCIGK
ncbi:PQQ-like beta-propeller repeat protein [Pirellulaceae bacterium]|nr:PQQ-like beta-propeller repeat protein [Pirellulaceae bacterium]